MLLSYMDNLCRAASKIYEMLIKNNIQAELYVKKNLEVSKKFLLESYKDKLHEISFDTFNYLTNKFLITDFIQMSIKFVLVK